MKKTKIIFWTITGLFSAFMLFSSIPDIMVVPEAKAYMAQLGFPVYLLPFLGVMKLAGIVAILLPGSGKIKEWAYAGLFFDLLGATYSQIAANGMQPQVLAMGLPIALLFVSYVYSKKIRPAYIRSLVENWAQAVRRQELENILAHHSSDVVMFDVPPPFQSVGIDAYRKTWDLFFNGTKPGTFDIQSLNVFADDNVAFCVATMRCADCSGDSVCEPLDFRLTIGLKKIAGKWTIVHEHHSVPAE